MPLPTAGLVAHWETDSGLNFSGGTVSSWVDQVNGYTLTDAGNPPTSLTPTGETAIAFNGISQKVDAVNTAMAAIPASGARTMLAVWRYGGAGSARAAAFEHGVSTNGRSAGLGVASNGELAFLEFGGNDLASGVLAGSGWMVQSFRTDGSVWTHHLDGTEIDSGTGLTLDTRTTTGSHDFRVGTDINQVGDLDGDVAAVLIYDTELSLADHTDAVDHLYTKYVSASTGTTATPTTGEATGEAFDATASVAVTAGGAEAIGEAFDAVTVVVAVAGTAEATGEAFDATVSTQAEATAVAGTAEATGEAFDATAIVVAIAGTAEATGEAFNATVSTSAETTATAGTATATGSAADATASITVFPGTAEATGEAFDATVSSSSEAVAVAGTAYATGEALDASVIVTVTPGTGEAAGEALDATALSVAIGIAIPTTATAEGEAFDADVLIAFEAGTGEATGVAYDVTAVGDFVATGLPARLQPHNLIVVRPAVSSNSYGDDVRDYGPAASRTSIVGWVQQDNRTEAFPDGRNPQEQRFLLMTNTLTIETGDRIEWLDHPTGPATFTVHGPPEIAYRAPSADPHHLEATLRIQQG